MAEALPDIVLHLGAHRTASTALQQALHRQRAALSAAGVGYWGPAALRGGKFPKLYKKLGNARPDAEGQQEYAQIIATNRKILHQRLAYQRQLGHQKLIVSDENLLGDMGQNARLGTLYDSAPNRLALLAGVFGDGCQRVVLCIRSYEAYWRSLLVFCIGDGMGAPDARHRARLAAQPRRWRHIVLELRTAFPTAQIEVLDFGAWAGQTTALIALLGETSVAPTGAATQKINASPSRNTLYRLLLARGDADSAQKIGNVSGVYQPFSSGEIAQMQADYAADLAWLKQTPPAGVRLHSG